MITVTGPEGTSEYRVAVMVKDALEALWPGIGASPPGEDCIKIAASVKISGYRVQDIDVVLAGKVSGNRAFRPTRVIRDRSGNKVSSRPVRVESFVVAIEVKDQDDRAVRVNDDQVSVKYTRSGKVEWKSATDQNVDQVHSLKPYLADQHCDVFVRRCLVLPNLASVTAPSAVAASFNGNQLMSAIAGPSPVRERKGQGVISAGSIEMIDKVLASPIFREVVPTRLDRERMDRLAANNPAVDKVLDTLGNGTVFLRGYGGTGKTALLLQAAWKQFRKEGKRTLLLTYNLALAADMRRLMSLMAIPSSTDDGGIKVGTVMSFLYQWFAKLHLLEDEEIDFDRYPELCATAIEMVQEGAVSREDIEQIISAEPEKFDFDHVFVDEGQDWPLGETVLLKALYSPTRLCVADGIDQLTRGQRADWRSGISREDRKTENLSTCLRLKRNLSIFVDAIAKGSGMGWEAEPNLKAGGGRVILLCRPISNSRDLYNELEADLRNDGNAPIDMLFCVPPRAAGTMDGAGQPRVADTLASWGKEFWDGTDPGNRTDFARSVEEARIVQYASCRGLEGWTVFLDGFDRFMEWTARSKVAQGLTDAEKEGFVDLETAAAREAWKWGMIALTRPIDTLVIQLDDPTNGYGGQVYEIATKFPDFTTFIE